MVVEAGATWVAATGVVTWVAASMMGDIFMEAMDGVAATVGMMDGVEAITGMIGMIGVEAISMAAFLTIPIPIIIPNLIITTPIHPMVMTTMVILDSRSAGNLQPCESLKAYLIQR